MITAIPNQPIDFIGPAFPDCSGTNPSPLKIGLEDTIIFQFLAGRCGDAEQLFDNTDFTEWSTQGNWDVKTNDACALEGQGGAYLSLDTFNPVVGDIYEVELVVTSIVGSITFTMGGYSNQVSGPGLHTFVFVASTTEKPIIYMDTDETAVCLFSCEAFDGNEDITVSLVDKDDVEVFSATFDTHPQYFTISEQHVTFIAPVSATGLTAGQCFKVFVTDACFYDEDEICSQTIEVIENCDNTIKIRACNDTDQEGMGFVAGRFEVRLPIQVVRPKYEYKSSEEKLADGTINRPYISRSKAWDMVLNDVFLGTSTHDFVSALCMFDHFYIGTTEYIVDASQYEPSYGESQTNTGSVSLTLRPKVDQFTKIACAAPGAGCNPINDPICNEPNVTFTPSFDDGGLYSINVAVSSMIGFVTESILLTVDGVTGAPIPFNTAPNDVDLGAWEQGTEVVITIVNADDEECNKSYSFEVPYCEGPHTGTFTSDYTGNIQMRIFSSGGAGTQFGTTRDDLDQNATFALGSFRNVANPDGLERTWCFWQSNSAGDLGTTMNQLSFNSPGYRISQLDISRLPNLTNLAAQNNLLTTLDLSANPLIQSVDVSGNNLASIILPPPSSALVQLDLGDNNLTSIDLAGYTSPVLNLFLEDNAFPSAMVDQILIDVEASNPTNDGILRLNGGTSGAPTAASLAARTALLARTWSILTN